MIRELRYFSALSLLILVMAAVVVPGQTQMRRGAPRELASQLLKDDPGVKDLAGDLSVNQVAENLWISKADLNGDKVLDYIVFGSSLLGSAAQNMVFWIYRKNGGEFIRIPVEGNPMAASIKVEKIKTKGYFNLQVWDHGGCATCGTKTVYKFNGTRYVPK